MPLDCNTITDIQFSPTNTNLRGVLRPVSQWEYALPPNHSRPSANDVFFLAESWLWNSAEGYLQRWDAESSPAAANHFQHVATMQSLSATWKHHVTDAAVSTDVDTISETVENIFEIMSRFGPTVIDLSEFENKNVNGEHLATVLRVTSSHRDQIQGWNTALTTAIAALEAAHQDPRDALAGLIG